MVCRNVICHEDRYLTADSCLITMKPYGNFSRFDNDSCFSYFLRLVPFPESRILYDSEKGLLYDIRETITSLTHIFPGMHYQYLYFVSINNDLQIEFFVFYILVQFEKDTTRFTYVNFIDRLMRIQNTSVVFQTYGVKFNVEVAQYNYTVTNESVAVCVPNQFDRCKKELRTHYNGNFLCSVEETSMINKLYVCPFIQIHIDDFPCKIENDFLIFAVDAAFNQTIKVLSRWEYEIRGETIDICLSDFEDIYLNMPISKSKTGVSATERFHPKHIISLVFICFSIFCLLVTIVTYGRFSSLQTQPGINNMILSVFLLLAQSFYQFGSGQNSVSDWACSLIGGICHFLWLSVMFAMNNCCTQMFLIFKKHYLISPKYKVKQQSEIFYMSHVPRFCLSLWTWLPLLWLATDKIVDMVGDSATCHHPSCSLSPLWFHRPLPCLLMVQCFRTLFMRSERSVHRPRCWTKKEIICVSLSGSQL